MNSYYCPICDHEWEGHVSETGSCPQCGYQRVFGSRGPFPAIYAKARNAFEFVKAEINDAEFYGGGADDYLKGKSKAFLHTVDWLSDMSYDAEHDAPVRGSKTALRTKVTDALDDAHEREQKAQRYGEGPASFWQGKREAFAQVLAWLSEAEDAAKQGRPVTVEDLPYSLEKTASGKVRTGWLKTVDSPHRPGHVRFVLEPKPGEEWTIEVLKTAGDHVASGGVEHCESEVECAARTLELMRFFEVLPADAQSKSAQK